MQDKEVTYRIEAYVIIDSRDGDRWGSVYETERGAVSAFNHLNEIKFRQQDVYIIQPLVLLGG